MAPFWNLRARNATAVSTIFYNTVGDEFPIAIWKSAHGRHWAIGFINLWRPDERVTLKTRWVLDQRENIIQASGPH
ncbi:uncharacterized protein RSE6_06861 [Rhynchosporium secalis]|uniref:Uncharacterized protein n=1 Tax=Rhynchosporium secalis TaxID=38038 RepID=A0A1E1MCF6_RHYSE|nr:uncharacterized protein RSE6_06861 [Rhynchosporium secalis]